MPVTIPIFRIRVPYFGHGWAIATVRMLDLSVCLRMFAFTERSARCCQGEWPAVCEVSLSSGWRRRFDWSLEAIHIYC